MDEEAPTLDQWRRLYQAAGRVKEIAPWDWLEEVDIFGVREPESGEIAFVSVMGMAGEHFAVSIYVGPKALYQFWSLDEEDPDLAVEQVLQIRQLQASFEDRDQLDKEDREVIKSLGLKFRGGNAWPMFRSILPGHLPWHITGDEARLLAVALEQLPDVALRLKENPELLDEVAPGPIDYLIRDLRREDGNPVWEDRIEQIQPPEAEEIFVEVGMEMIAQARNLPVRKMSVEVDLFMMPAPIAEEGRPYFPYMLPLVETRAGMILGFQMLTPQPTLEAMWATIPDALTRAFIQVGFRPDEVRVRSDLLVSLLPPLAKELGFKLKEAKKLPKLEQARAGLFSNLLGG